MTMAKAAIILEQDPAFTNQVLAVMKLLNESARKAIRESVCKCFEGIIDYGGYRFSEYEAIPLIRLESVSKNQEETQRVVERVVKFAIKNEIVDDEIEKLVDWVLAGNDPEEYLVEEA